MATYPRRTIRVPDPVWARVHELATQAGTDASTLIRGMLSHLTGIPEDTPATRIEKGSTPE